ncbi:hypothetical protein RM550_19990 [Streptomyces sp. DSM 41527]|uniref:Uncharacterized protein n=1 Tax=Streptomyces mooreae TaxID=3075523 RepID=A0ABU2TAP7_9ACTN|nr:hypothetical protein [Streptomyces sp. DSM 41527]
MALREPPVGLRLLAAPAQRLVEASFGPERSVVEAAIQEAGWVRT